MNQGTAFGEAAALGGDVPAAVARARPGAGWLVSPAFDGTFFLGSALAVVAAWLAVRSGVAAFTVLAVVGVVSNGPHLTSTWTRVYLDRGVLLRRPFAFVGVPLLIGATVLAVLLYAPRPLRLLNSGILYWATWHFAAQCHGLVRLYQRRSGEAARPIHRVESWFVFAVAAAGLLWRLHFGPRTLFGEEALSPPLPVEVVWAAFALACTAGAAIAADRVVRWRRGEALGGARLAFLGATVAGFWVPFLAIRDGTAAFAAAACWHGFQYLGIVYHFNRRRFRHGPEPRARVVSWVSQPGRWPAYVALLLGLAGGAYAVIYAAAWLGGWPVWQVGAVTWTSLTFSHYWVDGLIWKVRRTDLAETLGAV